MSDESARNARIQALVEHIEGDKEKFLADLHKAIKDHVGAQKPYECLRIVTRRDGREVTWGISDNVDYALRFVAYLRKTPFKMGQRVYEVDSVLTRQVLDIVTDKLSQVIMNNRDVIADIALTEIMLNDSMRNLFLDVLLKGKAVHLLGVKGKSMLAASLLHGMQEKLHHFGASVVTSLGEKVSQLLVTASKSAVFTTAAGVASKVIASASGKIIIAKFSMVIAESLAPLIAKLLAMPILHAALQKLVVAAVVSSLAKIIAAKLGIGIGAALMWVLVPLILGMLGRDIWLLPKKLGVALAEAVCYDLRQHYTKSITDIVTGLLANFTSEKVIEELAKGLSDDPAVSAELGKLIDDIAGGLAA